MTKGASHARGQRQPFPRPAIVALFLATVFAASAARADEPTTLAPLQEEMVARLFGPVEREADLAEFAARATALKVPDQTISEAWLAYGIRTRTVDEHLRETIRELDALCQKLQWRKEDSRLFNTPGEAQGALSFARALVAAQEKNEAEYESDMKQAFWMNPEMGPILAGELRVHREMASLLNLKAPMNKPLKTSTGEPKTFNDLIVGKKALLLVFWTSDNALSVGIIDALKPRIARLADAGVETVWINAQDERGRAEQVRKSHDVKSPWLVDTEDRPMAKLLRVDSVPRAVLIDEYGRVRYHGYPQAAELDSALKDLGADVTPN